MPKHAIQNRFIGFAGTLLLAVALSAPSAVAQQVSLESYQNLLKRMESLEKKLSKMDRLEREVKSLKRKQKQQAAEQQVVVVERTVSVADEESLQGLTTVSRRTVAGTSTDESVAAFTPEPPRRSDIYARGEVTILKQIPAHSTAFNFEGNSNTAAGIPETTNNVSFNDDVEAGYRFEAGYAPQQGLGWAARYWHFSSEASATAVDPGPNGNITADFFDDADVKISTGNDESIFARRELELNVFDAEITLANVSAGGMKTTFIGGLRVADADLSGDWSNPGLGGNSTEVIRIDNEFTGAGPTVGMLVAYPLMSRGDVNVTLFGSVRGSVMFGKRDFRASEVRTNAAGVFAGGDLITINDKDSFVYSGEAQLGLEASMMPVDGSSMELFARAHVEGQYWIGLGTISPSDSSSGDSDDGQRMLEGNQSFVGGAVSIGVRIPLE